jgi:hypothetical protein
VETVGWWWAGVVQLWEALLLSKQASLVALDAGFKVEIAFMTDMVGQGGEARVQEKFLAAMPTLEKAAALADVVQRGVEISSSELFKFCNKGAQGSLTTCIDMLGKMMLGKPPQLPAETSPFIWVHRCKAAVFCRTTVTDGKKHPKSLSATTRSWRFGLRSARRPT